VDRITQSYQAYCEFTTRLAKGYGSEVTILHAIPSVSVFAEPLVDQYTTPFFNEGAEKLIKKAGIRAGVRSRSFKGDKLAIQVMDHHMQVRKVE
jgi:hypothetical protein